MLFVLEITADVFGQASKTETYLCRVNKDKVEEFYEKLEEYKKGAPAEDS